MKLIATRSPNILSDRKSEMNFTVVKLEGSDELVYSRVCYKCLGQLLVEALVVVWLVDELPVVGSQGLDLPVQQILFHLHSATIKSFIKLLK